MKEEVRVLKELIEEIAKKHNVYISLSSFYGDGSMATLQEFEDKGTSTFLNM